MPDPLVPIREILRRTDMILHVENAQPNKAYAWEKFGGAAANNHLTRAKMIGWECVKGEDPENPGQRDANSICTVGDVALMRIDRSRLEEVHRELAENLNKKRGVEQRDERMARVNEELSRVMGRRVNVAFTFDDRSELDSRRGV